MIWRKGKGRLFLLNLFLAFTVPKSHLTTPNCNGCRFTQTTISIVKQKIQCIIYFYVIFFKLIFWRNISLHSNCSEFPFHLFFLLLSFFTFIFLFSSKWQFVWAKTCLVILYLYFHYWCFLEVTVCVSKNYSKCGPFVLLFSFCFCLFCLFSVLSFFTFIDASSRWQFVWVKSIPKCEPIAFICSSCHAIPHLLNHTSLIPWYWLNISRACKQDWRQPTIQFHWNCYRNCHHFRQLSKWRWWC